MNTKILCVDDDENILQGIKRNLRGKYDIETVTSGAGGIASIQENGGYAVVVSDMRMPEMDGAEFLSHVKTYSPDSVRIMLTGNSDQETAIKAVNEGSIFRFLNKPCSSEVLANTIDAALEQYRLKTVEKELLEVTLNKSLHVLVDILSLVNPIAFSRSNRIKRIARDIGLRLGVANLWEIEIAGMLSQIGCITVPEEVMQKISNGEAFTDEELVLHQRHPDIAFKLISQIPRMENVAAIIRDQNRRVESGDLNVSLGARILKVVLDYDKLIELERIPDVAYAELRSREGWYQADVILALKDCIENGTDDFIEGEIKVAELLAGMVLVDPIRTSKGTLLLSAGQEVTLSMILRLTNFMEAGFIDEDVKVRIPKKQAS